jgi:cytohesin
VRNDITTVGTYVGVLRTRDDYHVVCRWGEWQGLGFGHLGYSPAEFLVEEILRIEAVPRAPNIHPPPGSDCIPPNWEQLCREVDLESAVNFGCVDKVRQILRTEGIDSDGGKASDSLRTAILRDREGMVRLLLDAGAPVNPKDETHWFPLTVASGKERIFRMLIDAGAKVDRKDSNGLPLLVTTGFIFASDVRELLKAGADPNARDKDGVTALMKAAATGRAEVVRLLLEHGAKINLADKRGRTALMHAAEGEGRQYRIDAIPLLLARGADTRKRDKLGLTALDIATELGHRYAVDLLKPTKTK